MSILKYKALLKALECNSLTLAAKQLGYTQPGISHMILSLEKEMGFPLLIRSKEGISPTPELEDLLIYIRQIVTASEKLQETIDKINGIATGTVRIGSFYSIALQWLPSIAHSFTEKYPQINLQFFEGDEGELTHWLINGHIDLAIMSAPAPDGFEFYPLMEDPVLAIIPSSHPLAGHKQVDPSELVRYPFIIPFNGSDEDVMRVLKGENLTPEIKFRVKGDETILAMIAKELGVTALPALLVKRLPANVTSRPLTRHYARNLGIAVRSKKYASPATARIIEEITAFVTAG